MKKSNFFSLLTNFGRTTLLFPFSWRTVQPGGGGHAGERVQRLGDHRHLHAGQSAAGGGRPPDAADGQRLRLHDLHLRGRLHVQPPGYRRGPVRDN